MPNPKLKKVAVLSLAVLAAQLLLTLWVYPFVNVNAQQLFSIQTATGIGSENIGNTVLGYLTSYVPFELFSMATLVMFLGTFVLIWAGFFLYEQKAIKLWQGRNYSQKIFALLLYGHVVLYAVLFFMKKSVEGIAMSLAFGLLINLLLVTLLITASVKYLKWPKV